MTNALIQIGLSNACFSLILAVVAMIVGAKSKRPHITHMLWLLVFIKLVTPPLLTIPVARFSVSPEKSAITQNYSQSKLPDSAASGTAVSSMENTSEFNTASHLSASASSKSGFTFPTPNISWILAIALIGSLIALGKSMITVIRFNRLLMAETKTASPALQETALRIARRLNLRSMPKICTTNACISPMVWWTGGRVRVIIPAVLIKEIKERDLHWVLAHELAHVHRKDHLVRWIEWLACICFWWNPVVWWAQRNLRAAEEICCDALVLSSLNPKPRTYANSILAAVESLAYPIFRPPAMASEINSGGHMEKRFKMIVSSKTNLMPPRWLQGCILICALTILPFGLGYALDYDAVEERLEEAVEEGEITEEQFEVMMDALRESTEEDHEERLEDIGKFLKAAVATGMMTEKDAREKWEAIKKERHREDEDDDEDEDEEHGEDVKRDLHEWAGKIARELNEGVANKKMTQDDAWKKWFKIKHSKIRQKVRHLIEKGAMTEEQAHRFWAELEEGEFHARIRQAVERGDLTEEEAKKRIANYGKEQDEDKDFDFGTWMQEVTKELHKARKNKKITEEEGWIRWEKIKNETVGPKLRSLVEEGRMEEKEAWRIWFEIKKNETGERIRQAQRKDKMTEEDAKKKWEAAEKEYEESVHKTNEAIDKRNEENADPDEDDEDFEEVEDEDESDQDNDEKAQGDGTDYDQIAKDLKKAIDAGEISEEEAIEKWKEIKRKND